MARSPALSRTQSTPAACQNPAIGGKNIPALDGVRALAILMVLAERFVYFDSDKGSAIERHIVHVASTGWAGVQLFFVLSGFLITAILLDTRGADNYFKAFYARRTLRIFPVYYAFLIVLLFVPGVFQQALANPMPQVWTWTFLMNWTQQFSGPIPYGPHLWSLGVEEQFYLFWPLLVYRLRAERLLWVCGGIIVGALAVRTGLWLVAGESIANWNYTFTVCRMDALAVGAACAALLRLPAGHAFVARNLWRIVWGGAIIFIAGLLVTRGYPRTSFLGQTIGYSALALTFGAVVLVCAVYNSRTAPSTFLRTTLSALQFAPLRSIGKYSYAMYLFHAPLHVLVGQPMLKALSLYEAQSLWQNLVYAVLAGALTYALAFVSYHLWEKHFLKRKPPYVFSNGARRTPGNPPQDLELQKG